MKTATDYFDKGLGRFLGWLVGALVFGTSFPPFLKLISGNYSWGYVIISTSTLAILGGILIVLFVPKGPYYKINTKPNLTNLYALYNNKKFFQLAIGYFGHMRELSAFRTFIPIIIGIYNKVNPQVNQSIPLCSFIIIIIGSDSLACIFIYI